MYSNRSEYSQRQPHGDRRSKQWDQHDDSWEKRHESHRGFLQDAFRKHGADADRHSDSPQRQYSRDRDCRSPLRRPVSSPVWDVSEKKRPRYSDDEKSDHRFQYEHQKRTYRQPAESFPDTNTTRNFKYRETPQDFRHRRRLEESENKQRHDGVTCRRSSAGYREQDGSERSRDRSQERQRSQERYTKIPVKPRETPDSPSTSTYQEDHRQSAELWQNGSSKQAHEGAVTTEPVKGPKQEQTKGFQRFLDVLNKGVNVDTLTKIVTQCSTDVTRQPSNRLPRAVDQSWTPRHVSPQNSRRPPRHRSLSPMKGLQREDQVRLRENTTPTTEDQNKCRQMQDVLQAIGMDLGFEELGQMSHRIQERLYGRKDVDPGRRVGRETGSKPSNSPRRRSGSSSSRSSFTPLSRDGFMMQDSFSAETDSAGVQQTQKTYQGQSAEYQLDSGSRQGQSAEYQLDSGSRQGQSAEYQLDSGSRQGRYQLDSGSRQGRYQLDSGSQQGRYQLDSGSQECQYELDSGSQEGQFAEYQLDSGSQEGQYKLDSRSQHDQYRRNYGSQEAESCDSASSQQGASPFTYAPSVRPAPPSVHPSPPSVGPPPPSVGPPPPSMRPPGPVMSHYPSAVLFPPLPHVSPGMFLPQRPPFFPSAPFGQPGPPPLNPSFQNPLPLNPSFQNQLPLNPSFRNPPPLNPSFPNPPPLNPSFPNPPPLTPSFRNPPPLNPSFPNPPPLNPSFSKAVPRQRCLQVIETKPG